jgi:hypothetical protein
MIGVEQYEEEAPILLRDVRMQKKIEELDEQRC